MKRFLILLLMIFALCGCEGIIDGFINPDSKTDVTEVETEDNQTNDEQKTDIPTEDDPITDIPTGDDRYRLEFMYRYKREEGLQINRYR